MIYLPSDDWHILRANWDVKMRHVMKMFLIGTGGLPTFEELKDVG